MKLLRAKQKKLAARPEQAGFWWSLLLFAALSIFMRPKVEEEALKPAGLGDINFPTATEDRVIPLIWGTVQVKGPNIVWYGDLVQEAITKKQKTGLFSSKTTIVGFRYFVGIQFAFCRGQVDSLLRIWIGDDQVFTGPVTHAGAVVINEPELFGGEELGTGGVVGSFVFFDGREDQAVSSYLSGFQLEGTKTPAYRGTSYMAPVAAPTLIGTSPNLKPWKFELRRLVNGLSLSAGEAELNGGNDCNPMNVLFEIFTNTEWGLKQPAAKIDIPSFEAAATTLTTEGNGFSFVLDKQIEAIELVEMIEQQISGKVFFNQTTAKWEVALARDDYDIDLVPVISEANAIDIKEFTRGGWEDTTNIVRTKFNDRANEYQSTFGLAQDSANIQLQDGVNVSTTINYGGVKDATLANALAWRDLRTLSYPLAKATFVMDRTFYDTHVVDVFAFTSTKFGLTKLPMRVTRVDIGDLVNNRVTIDCVEDIFYYIVGSFGDPGATGWVPPVDTLLPFLAAEQLAFESPRGFVSRDPEITGLPSLIWAGARLRGNEVSFKIVERHASGTPTGSFNEAGESFAFLLIGELNATLASGQISPTTTITITNTPDTQSDLIDKFDESKDEISGDVPGVEDIGTNLINLVYVWNGTDDGEFMLVTDAVVNGGSNVDMKTVYRGVLDTVQQSFAAGDQVFLVFAGGSNTLSLVPETDNVDVKLLPRSATDQVLASAATEIAFLMAKRVRRPYCPSEVSIGPTRWASTVSLEQLGGGDDAAGFAVDFIRRDYRVGDGGDEILGLTTDAATLDASFPAANSTTHDMELREDPDGGNVLLHTDSGITGTDNDQVRTQLLHDNGAVLPTRLRVVFDALHDEGGDTALTSRQQLIHDFNVTSALTGQFEFGDLDGSPETSATYTVDAAGVHNFTIGTAFPTTGNVEISINGAGFTTLIAQGLTSGSTGSLSVSDTIRVRHDSVDANALTHLQMTAPGAGTDAWGILFV